MSNHQTQELVPLRISSDGQSLVRDRCGETVQDVPAWPKQGYVQAKVIYWSKASDYRGSPTTRECSSFGSRELQPIRSFMSCWASFRMKRAYKHCQQGDMDRNTTTLSVTGLPPHDEKTNRYRKDALAAGAGEIRTQPVARLLRGSPGRDGTSKWP